MAKKSTRRGNNEGCISKRKDGSWVGVVTLGTDENGKRIRKSVYGKTKSEVTMKMLAVKADNPTIGCSAIKNENFQTLMQEWLMTFKHPSVSPRTFERCLSNARITLYPLFGEMKIDEITAPMIQRLFNKMSTDGYALATIKKIKFLLGQFFEYCVDSDFLKVNAVAKTKLASKERKVQTAEEYKAIPPELRKDFVKALDTSPILKPICYTSLFAGLRIGEVLALRWRDIDFTDKTIWVDNAVTVIPHYDKDGKVCDYETVISDTKTAASVRSVPMPQVLIDCLKEHRKRRRNMEYDTGIFFTDDDDLVFSNEEGELRTYYGTRAMFDKLMKKAGFDEYGFHFHTLRHTYSSMLFESGENPKVIQMLLGHKDVTTTIRTYNSVDKSYFKQATRKIDAMFGSDMEM